MMEHQHHTLNRNRYDGSHPALHHYVGKTSSNYEHDPEYFYQIGSSPPPPPPPIHGESREMPMNEGIYDTKILSDMTRKSSKQPVKLSVCVRMRPIIPEDHKQATTKRNAPEICVHFKSDGQTIKLIQDPQHFKNFKVDHTFDAAYGQHDVYNVALKPIVRDVIKGYNGTCMVYGQTASGKTYTMFGSDGRKGIAHLAVHEIFSAVKQYEQEDLVAKVFISFYQIYLENIYDLLGETGYGFDAHAPGTSNAVVGGGNGGIGPSWNQNSSGVSGFGPTAVLALDMKQQTTLPSLNIREDSERGIYVENLHYCYAKDCENAFELISQGLQRRKVNSTAFNVKSSRSHAILQIYCDFEERSNEPPLHGQSEVKYDTGSQYQHSGNLIEKKYMVRRRTLTLVDLAGSERVQTYKQSSKKQLLEASMINKSIAALGNCIYALSNREHQSQLSQNINPNNIHVPYRDCKLTRLLSESLGGNAKTSIIATVSPCLYNHEETLSTLKFASRAKVIRKVVKRTKMEEIIVEPKVLNYFQPFHDHDIAQNVYREEEQEDSEVGGVEHFRDESQIYYEGFDGSFPEDHFMNELGTSRTFSRHARPQRLRATSNSRPPRPPTPSTNGLVSRQHPQSQYSGASVTSSSGISSTFTLRDFLRACTVASKVADPNGSTVEYELPPSSPFTVENRSIPVNASFSPIQNPPPLLLDGSPFNHPHHQQLHKPPAIHLPISNFDQDFITDGQSQGKSRRPSSGTVASDTSESLTIFTPSQTPRPGYSSIPSKVDEDPVFELDEFEDYDVHSDSASPFPHYQQNRDSLSPTNTRNRRPSFASTGASSNNSALSLLAVGEIGTYPNRTAVSIGRFSPHPNNNDSQSVSTMGSLQTRTPARSRSSKGVQTWSIVPEMPTQKYNGSLDDFGNYAQSTKVDQATEVEPDILFETASTAAIPQDKEEFAKLMRLPTYDLAVAIIKLRDTLREKEESYEILKELMLENMNVKSADTPVASSDSYSPMIANSSSAKF